MVGIDEHGATDIFNSMNMWFDNHFDCRQYDSIHEQLSGTIATSEEKGKEFLTINSDRIQVFHEIGLDNVSGGDTDSDFKRSRQGQNFWMRHLSVCFVGAGEVDATGCEHGQGC